MAWLEITLDTVSEKIESVADLSEESIKEIDTLDPLISV